MPARDVWLIGAYEMAAGIILILFCFPSPSWPVLALAAAIVLYDAWHKQSPLSVITMGACRWLLYVTTASVTGESLRSAMICGAVVWLYIVVLSLVARGEARQNGGASSRSRWLLLLVPAALAAVGLAGPFDYSRDTVPGYSVPVWLQALTLFAAGLAVMLPWRSRHVGMWVNRLLAAIPLLDLALVLLVFPAGWLPREWLAAILFMVLLSLWFQRWFKAT
jgi:hypothetical protein